MIGAATLPSDAPAAQPRHPLGAVLTAPRRATTSCWSPSRQSPPPPPPRLCGVRVRVRVFITPVMFAVEEKIRRPGWRVDGLVTPPST